MIYVHPDKESSRAKLLKLAMDTIGFRYRYEKMLRRGKFNDTAAPLPSSFKKRFQIEEQKFHDHSTWTLSPLSEKNGQVILYLHGGGYVNNIVHFQWRFVGEIVDKTKATVVVVDYPLAPKFSHRETYQMVNAVYEHLLDKYSSKDIIFMGDSAGGGLSLGYAQLLRNERKPLPGRLILLSPWLDMTGTNPAIPALEPFDYLLTLKALPVNVLYGKDTDLRDFRLSPLFGEMENLPPIAIFSGTHEMLHVDSAELHKKLIHHSIAHQYYVYPKMFHVWMAVTFLKESKKVIEQITVIINS